jgi:hypothetical protein
LHEEDNEEIFQISATRARKKDVKWCDEAPTFLFPNLRQKVHHLRRNETEIEWAWSCEVFEELFSDDVINVIVEEPEG